MKFKIDNLQYNWSRNIFEINREADRCCACVFTTRIMMKLYTR